MLFHLYVKNLALIDSAEVEFDDGLNILTIHRTQEKAGVAESEPGAEA